MSNTGAIIVNTIRIKLSILSKVLYKKILYYQNACQKIKSGKSLLSVWRNLVRVHGAVTATQINKGLQTKCGDFKIEETLRKCPYCCFSHKNLVSDKLLHIWFVKRFAPVTFQKAIVKIVDSSHQLLRTKWNLFPSRHGQIAVKRLRNRYLMAHKRAAHSDGNGFIARKVCKQVLWTWICTLAVTVGFTHTAGERLHRRKA